MKKILNEERKKLDCCLCTHYKQFGLRFYCTVDNCEARSVGYDADKIYPSGEVFMSEEKDEIIPFDIGRRQLTYGNRIWKLMNNGN